MSIETYPHLDREPFDYDAAVTKARKNLADTQTRAREEIVELAGRGADYETIAAVSRSITQAELAVERAIAMRNLHNQGLPDEEVQRLIAELKEEHAKQLERGSE